VVSEEVGGGKDTVYASVNYTLTAGQEVELLVANAGVTGLTLSGNGLNNTVAGGAGNDKLTGGAGADTFLFNTTLNGAANVDHITDFVAADDTINLENGVFTALTTTGRLATSAFYANAGAIAAHDSDDRIVYNTNNGDLFYDPDGIGFSAATKFAVLDTHPTISNANFFVV
jgi:Ca2+-binding RTX toxin-like protein